jgi:hypothetical protein
MAVGAGREARKLRQIGAGHGVTRARALARRLLSAARSVPGLDERRLTQLARLGTDPQVLAEPDAPPPPHLARRKDLASMPKPTKPA